MAKPRERAALGGVLDGLLTSALCQYPPLPPAAMVTASWYMHEQGTIEPKVKQGAIIDRIRIRIFKKIGG